MSTNITLLNDNRADSDSDVIAHRTGCQDIARLIKRNPRTVEIASTIEANSERGVFLSYNEDFIEEGDEEAAWPITFAPCCKLPAN